MRVSEPRIAMLDGITTENLGAHAMYQFHQDCGHGWLEVPMSEIRALGIADQISGYSYQSRDGRTAYLEEDCDLSRFVDAKLSRVIGRAPSVHVQTFFETQVRDVYYREDCFIRHLPRFPSARQTHTAALFAVGAL